MLVLAATFNIREQKHSCNNVTEVYYSALKGWIQVGELISGVKDILSENCLVGSWPNELPNHGQITVKEDFLFVNYIINYMPEVAKTLDII